MAFQSLYRRYRPRRFAEVRGQDHVVAALRNAVRDHTVAHAYLFSGPRGTGKTSSARILAKALNCDDPRDGEPCCECGPCRAVEAGTSLDVSELDAASNNGVDAMRDLVSRVALATGGRTKLYILDEVHMLSTAASNTLLKTLEEPPEHVVFVLATTDPQKVLPTIRSRTQHLEFRLLGAGTLRQHLRWVVDDAGLGLPEPVLDVAVRRGRGSARDALSALDQIVAAGGETDEDVSIDELAEALCERDTGRALAAVASACGAGRDPRQVAAALLSHLRDAFLSIMAPDVVSLPDTAFEQVADQGRRLGPAAAVRALDTVGDALLAMREAPDPRVALEVALVRVTRPEADASPAALLERVERLERAVRRGGEPAEGPDLAGVAL
ncbi:MAG: DNA polymerase III subunit gamma/tau, partial [Acidimicrobiales bacterium]